MPRVPVDSTAHFTPAQPKCPVCSNPADVYLRKDQTKFEGWCELCGDVTITLEASEKLRGLNKGHVLSRWLATHQHEPELMDLEYVETFLKETPMYTVLEKLDLALSELSSRALQPGQFYIALVAMWFDEKVDRLYADAIEPAILGAGYKSLRMKELEHVNRIDDEIIAQIRRSRFMVADFTGQRGGVYFESGYMLGQGRNVFWMCENSELEKVHFDTRQYNFINYKDLEEAKKRLLYRILAVEGEGPNKTVIP
jgi:hypothetical protein